MAFNAAGQFQFQQEGGQRRRGEMGPAPQFVNRAGGIAEQFQDLIAVPGSVLRGR